MLWFLVTSGTSPLISYYVTARSSLVTLNQTISENKAAMQTYIDTFYAGSTCLHDMISHSKALFPLVDTLYHNVDCPALYNIWHSAIDQAMCSDGYGALFYLLIGKLAEDLRHYTLHFTLNSCICYVACIYALTMCCMFSLVCCVYCAAKCTC